MAPECANHTKEVAPCRDSQWRVRVIKNTGIDWVSFLGTKCKWMSLLLPRIGSNSDKELICLALIVLPAFCFFFLVTMLKVSPNELVCVCVCDFLRSDIHFILAAFILIPCVDNEDATCCSSWYTQMDSEQRRTTTGSAIPDICNVCCESSTAPETVGLDHTKIQFYDTSHQNLSYSSNCQSFIVMLTQRTWDHDTVWPFCFNSDLQSCCNGQLLTFWSQFHKRKSLVFQQSLLCTHPPQSCWGTLAQATFLNSLLFTSLGCWSLVS